MRCVGLQSCSAPPWPECRLASEAALQGTFISRGPLKEIVGVRTEILRIGEQMGRDKEKGWRKARRSDARRHRHPTVPGVAGGPPRSKHQRPAPVAAQTRSPEKGARCLALALMLGLCPPRAGLAQ